MTTANDEQISARRHYWCLSRAIWHVIYPLRASMIDLDGVADDDPHELVGSVARDILEEAATISLLVDRSVCPLPPPTLRLPMATGLDADPRLVTLMRTLGAELAHTKVSGSWRKRVVRDARAIGQLATDKVGEVPDLMSPDGIFGSIRVARQWSELLGYVGESTALFPAEWVKPIGSANG